MKILCIVYLVTLLPLNYGFVITSNNNQHIQQQQQQYQYQLQRYNTNLNQQTIALEPEPEGGKELVPRNSLAGCRMKELEFVREANIKKIDTEQGPIYKFWMSAQAEGVLIKEIRATVLKDASKKANFPGFRKGQVPPYAQPQITQFSVQEAIIRTCQSVVDCYGLKSLPGTEGEVKVHEDVDSICKKYKIGDTVQFTASINAMYDPEMMIQAAEVESQEQEAVVVEVKNDDGIQEIIINEQSQESVEAVAASVIDVIATSE